MTTPFDPVADLRVGNIVEVAGTAVKAELLGDVSELTPAMVVGFIPSAKSAASLKSTSAGVSFLVS